MDRTTSGSTHRPHLGSIMRFTWAITSVVLTLAMITMAWVNRARVASAVNDLDQSQGEVLLSEIRETLRILPAPPDAAVLDSVLARRAHDSLKSLAFYGSDERLIASAGQSLSPAPLTVHPARGEPLPVATTGGRIRMLGFYRPTRRTETGVTWRTGGAGVPEPSPSVIVVEFDPILARDLLSDADRTFALAALTGAGLVAVTLLFWRLSARYDAAQQRIERERRLAVLGEMSAVLAHEIRNPLASLKGNAQLLSRRLGPGSAESRKAELVVTEAERLEALTADLLDFVRSGTMDIHPADPVELVATCIREVAPDGIVLRTDGAPRRWPLDAPRVRQALVNLLRNALQASPAGVKPIVTVGQEGSKLVVTVQDSGGGIRPGDEERVFAPFFTTKLSGTGLGLAIARRIAEAHAGTIVAANHDGGALFRIILPALPTTNGGPAMPRS